MCMLVPYKYRSIRNSNIQQVIISQILLTLRVWYVSLANLTFVNYHKLLFNTYTYRSSYYKLYLIYKKYQLRRNCYKKKLKFSTPFCR